MKPLPGEKTVFLRDVQAGEVNLRRGGDRDVLLSEGGLPHDNVTHIKFGNPSCQSDQWCSPGRLFPVVVAFGRESPSG